MTDQPPVRASRSSEGAIAGASKPPLRVILAAPRGFCAGVTRAIAAVDDALERFGAPVYVRRPIVHNLAVVRTLEAKGAVFVEELDQVPEGGTVIMSAHGVEPNVLEDAELRGLKAFDAVCPLVAKVHREVVRHHAGGRHVILIGHEEHPEVVGTLGHVPASVVTVVKSADDVRALSLPDDHPVAYAIQTTYSVDDARTVVEEILSRFADVQRPSSSDICYATTNRQTAIRDIARSADAVIVAGEQFSSNASRLAELAHSSGCPSVQLVPDAAQIDWPLLSNARTLGLTAAASTPEDTVNGIIAAMRYRYDVELQEDAGEEETMMFKPMKFA